MNRLPPFKNGLTGSETNLTGPQKTTRVLPMPNSMYRVVQKAPEFDLRQSSVFANLSSEALVHLENNSQPMVRPRRHVIFREGELADGFYIVCGGQVKLFATSSENRLMILKIAKTGDLVGLCATLNRMPHEVSAETLEPSVLRHITRNFFLNFLAAHAEAARMHC